MTPSLEPSTGGEGGCPCGRYHPPQGKRRVSRGVQADAGEELVSAVMAGKAQPSASGWFDVDYSGDCQSAYKLTRTDVRYRTIVRWVRCRKCNACLRAKRNYWGFAAMQQTLEAEKAGNRTWFGTLTLSPEAQVDLLRRARDAHPEPHAEWWAEPHCDERFGAVREQFLGEVQKYWKRLRKEGHAFKYFVVFERHKSGLPHAHFLLHEAEGPIRKARLKAQWPHGFVQCSIVGGTARNAAAPEKAAWYAVKYLTKSSQARVVASAGYKPQKRSKTHSVNTRAKFEGDDRNPAFLVGDNLGGSRGGVPPRET